MILVRKLDPRAEWNPPKQVGDVGHDLEIWMGDAEQLVIQPFEFAELPTGLAIKLPNHVWGMIRARSSTIFKRHLFVGEGTIDSGYTGPLYVTVWNPTPEPHMVRNGESLAQLIVIPKIQHREDLRCEYVGALPNTPRGTAGFGSTGK